MPNIVRTSKYRHVYGERAKTHYDNVKITNSAWDTDFASAGGKYLAVNWQAAGGGAFVVLPLFSPFTPPAPAGFPNKLPDILPLCRGHTGPVLDTKWNPFNDNVVASAGEDGKVFIWKIEDSLFSGWGENGWQPEDVAPVTKLNAGGRKVGQIAFHPAASSLLASASGDHLVRLWDIESPSDASLTLKGHKDSVQSLCWNAVGTTLVTTCRDKKLRLYDPRAGAEAVRVADGHSGIKGSRVVWLGDRDRIATTGFSKMSERQLGLWDTSSLTNISMQGLDTSAGILMPFYAEGNDVLFIAGKGDGNVRYYEYADDELIYLSAYASSEPQRGMTMLPRRALEVGQNEIARMYKLAGSTVQPLSFMVPRKAESFQSDIYPPANSDEPALSAQDWLGGKSARPKVVDLETRAVSSSDAPIAAPPKADPSASRAAESSTPSTPAKRFAESEALSRSDSPSAEQAPTPKSDPSPVAALSIPTAHVPTPPPALEAADPVEIEQPDSEDEAPAPASAAAAKEPANTSSAGAVPTVTTPGINGTPAVVAPKDHLLVKRLSPSATVPTRGSALAAGYDIYASAATVIPGRGQALVSTDISIAVPEGTYGRIAPRSGLAVKHGIQTGAGVIDADYRGEVRVLLFNHKEEDFEVQKGDRIAQLVLEVVRMSEVREVESLEETARGAGGFGSTGGFGKA